MFKLSANSYVALCALVSDALQVRNDAAPLLAQVREELSMADCRLPADLRNDPRKVAALREAGFIREPKPAAHQGPTFGPLPSLDSAF